MTGARSSTRRCAAIVVALALAGCEPNDIGGAIVAVFAAIVFAAVIASGWVKERRADRKDYDRLVRGAATLPKSLTIDVSAVLIALDARARRFVLSRIEAFAEDGSSGARQRRLHQTISALRTARRAWRSVGVLNAQPMDSAVAVATFQKTRTDLAARDRPIANDSYRGGPSEALAQGESLLVVSLLVASHTELPDVDRATDLDQLDEVMRAIGALSPGKIESLAIIVAPESELALLDSRALAERYPELRPIPGAVPADTVFCANCACPFEAHVPRCPSCDVRAPVEVRQ